MSGTIHRFSPPGGLNDFSEKQRHGWHCLISESIDRTIIGNGNNPKYPKVFLLNSTPRPQFFNPSAIQKAPDLQEKKISWIGCPQGIKQKTVDASRDLQNEYCEWSVSKEKGKIKRVTFTCESPEYWEFLAKTDPDRLVTLYQTHVNPKAKKKHLFNADGTYRPKNKWNCDTKNGAMHMIQKDNTLTAAIEAAGAGSMVREVNGKIVEEPNELIKAGLYGETRVSDPLIGVEVNALARKGAQISLKDPVGIYFEPFNPQGWTTPDGSSPASYWKIVRGESETPVRAVYEVPADKGFSVSDITINGKKIKYGAQIAEFVKLKFTCIAQNFNEKNIETFEPIYLHEK